MGKGDGRHAQAVRKPALAEVVEFNGEQRRGSEDPEYRKITQVF